MSDVADERDWDAIDWHEAGDVDGERPETPPQPASRFVYRRYGDGIPNDGIFFFVYGGCRLCYDQGRNDCFSLVRDPIGTLLDRERWPNHWNNNTWRGLVERWAVQRYSLSTLDGTPAKQHAPDAN